MQAAGTDKAFIQLNGEDLRMGVNSSNATGNVVFRLNGGDRFTIFQSGNATLTGTLTQNSDARLKKLIKPISNPMSKLMLIKGYNYYWKSESSDHEMQTGVLAQEIQKVFPELVKEDGAGTLSVNYTGLIPYMIEAAKDQQQKLDDKQKQIDELKTRLSKLENIIINIR